MHLTIHRGTKEIGGSCVELKTSNSRLLIDLGMPLVNKKGGPFDSKILENKSLNELKELKLLPGITGLYKDEVKTTDAILISHSHLDHYGFLKYVHSDIPIYMSEGAKQLIKISDIFTPNKVGPINAKVVDKDKRVKIGDFVIIPYLVDHSAFDARAFLIEVEGKRLFYSGDFRGHGRKSILFKDMVNNPPKGIDCLLMEGSMLGRDKPDISAIDVIGIGSGVVDRLNELDYKVAGVNVGESPTSDEDKKKYECRIFWSNQDGGWISHSLNTDQIGVGSTPVKALKDMQKGVDAVFALAAEDETIQPWRKAPVLEQYGEIF